MNLFARNTGRESLQRAQTAEPHTARRAVRYAAADNAQAALQRQFPGTSFAMAQIAVQATDHKKAKGSTVGDLDGDSQAA